ncbi:MAG: endonuclease III domain-containing protein [Spirochaetes bacterium]|nr:endonuclease III domain-containing protein [Spirochaetota bacterium]
MKDLLKIYNSLLKIYGPQGWWPLLFRKRTKRDKENSFIGYHCGDYSYPKNNQQRFEICAGAVLTQNTAWTNVEKALINLNNNDLLNAKAVKETDLQELKKAIMPAGYYNQKAIYLKKIAEFCLSIKGRTPAREEILSVKGVGPETADSILLYAYNQPEFVVDAYTRRMFTHLNFFNKNAKYNEIKEIFENRLPKDVIVYQEFHALIVQHAKNHFSRKVKINESSFL